MADKNLIILSDAPAAVIAGSDADFGIIDIEKITTVLALADSASKSFPDQMQSEQDVAALRKSVGALADAVSYLAGELIQLEKGLRTGRITINATA